MLEFAGFWMGLATFIGIWWGHVGVRWIEAHSRVIWIPIVLFLVFGIGLNIYSIFASTLTLSGVASIIGITLLWDALEVWRQERRVIHGHAPANPDNPRHAAILAAGHGTTEDLLDREPQGYPIAPPQPATKQQPAMTMEQAEREYEYSEEVEA